MDFTIIIGNRNYSSWSLRGWLIAQKSGADFETRRIPLFVGDFYSKIKKLSPSGTVPVLHHADYVVHDSLAIGEYLAERYPQARLWPEQPGLRALARAYSCEMHSGFAAIRSEMPMNIRAQNRTVELSQDAEKQVQRVFEIWSDCLATDVGEPRADDYLLGRFTILDAMYIPIVFRFKTYGIRIPSILQKFVNCCLNDADVKAWVELVKAESEVLGQMEIGA